MCILALTKPPITHQTHIRQGGEVPAQRREVRPTNTDQLCFPLRQCPLQDCNGQSVEPDQWDADRQRAHTNQKGRAAREPFKTINGHLDRLRSAVKKVVTALQLAGIPLGNDTIKQYLDEELGRTPRGRGLATTTEPVESFTAYIDRFVRESKAVQRLNARNVHYADYTLAGYMKLKRVLERYRLETGSEVPPSLLGGGHYEPLPEFTPARSRNVNPEPMRKRPKQ